jgi:hypothetical protein
MHAAAAVALLQWQDIKLLHRVKDEQTCNKTTTTTAAAAAAAAASAAATKQDVYPWSFASSRG